MLRQHFCVTTMPVARPFPYGPVALSSHLPTQGFPGGCVWFCVKHHSRSKTDKGEQFRKYVGLCPCLSPAADFPRCRTQA